MNLIKRKKIVGLLLILTLVFLIICFAGCGKSKSNNNNNNPPILPGDGKVPDLTGTWYSPLSVNPGVTFTIGSYISKEQSSDGKVTHHYYQGQVSCSALESGSVSISHAPTLENFDFIDIMDASIDVLLICAGSVSENGGTLSLSGWLKNGVLHCYVVIEDQNGNTIYETDEESDFDIFTKGS